MLDLENILQKLGLLAVNMKPTDPLDGLKQEQNQLRFFRDVPRSSISYSTGQLEY